MNKFLLNSEFKSFYEISNHQTGRRLVMTDIHGFYNSFLELLNKVGLNKDDQLFLLGDFIDRGKKGKEVLDKLLELIEQNYHIFPLRGNHEEMAWQAHLKEYDTESLKLPSYKWGKDIIDTNRKILPEYVELISKLPYYYVLDEFYLVHAGFDFSAQNPFKDYYNMVWINEFVVSEDMLQGKTLIHGHSIKPLDEILESIKTRKNVIGLDNAVSISKNPSYGNLLCLNLNSYEVTIQPNID